MHERQVLSKSLIIYSCYWKFKWIKGTVCCRALVANESQAVGACGEATQAFCHPMTRVRTWGSFFTKRVALESFQEVKQKRLTFP